MTRIRPTLLRTCFVPFEGPHWEVRSFSCSSPGLVHRDLGAPAWHLALWAGQARIGCALLLPHAALHAGAMPLRLPLSLLSFFAFCIFWFFGGLRVWQRAQHVLPATDILALATMKNAAKCDTWCELQNSVNHQMFERNLRPRLIPRACLPERRLVLHQASRLGVSWPSVDSGARLAQLH